VLAVTRFEVAEDEAERFLVEARATLAAFSAREGYVRGRVGRSPDEPTAWVMTTEWVGVGAYRRGLSAYDVKVSATPLMARARDEPTAFEVLVTDADL
jgi:quinol monooxygenase YgiN